MKLPNIARLLSIAVLISLLSAGSGIAQDDESKSNSKDQKEAIAKLLKQLNGHMNEGEWSEVKEMMTEEAWDSYCTRLVLQCVSLTKVELDGIDLPGLEDSKDEIIEALEAHGLDELETDATLELRVHGHSDEDDEADDEEADDEEADDEDKDDQSEEEKDVEEKQNSALLAALDKDGDREKVVQELFQARKRSPFNLSLFAGDVLEIDAEEESDSLTVRVKPKPEERDSGGGIQLRMVGPPTVIVIKKIDDKWMYAGVDIKKTTEEAENFRPDMGDGPRTDF